jgi:archaemetzincin
MKFVYIAALGGVGEECARAAEEAVQSVFGLETRRLAWDDIVAGCFDDRRGQFNSALILRELHRRAPPDALRLLAVTDRDIFIPMLSFVFGQAQLGGRIALVSVARLRQEFYRLPANELLTLSRTVKETLHEMGHTFGLIHCPDPGCPMSLSTNVIHADRKSAVFCGACSAALSLALGSCPDL